MLALALALAAACAASSLSAAAAQHVVPGKVQWPLAAQSWSMKRSSAMMICNSSGRVDPVWAAQWGLIDLDWNGDKGRWSSTKPMTAEEDMVANMAAVKAVDPTVLTWVYRNGAKALPWHTSVRTLLEDRAQWGLFMPLAGCMPTPGTYVCGPNATNNLYHDFLQTPTGDCGLGVQCGEYVFNHLNASLTDFFLGEYFMGSTNGAGNPIVNGFYVDDGWNSEGVTEMDPDNVQKMGLSPDQVKAMIAAWLANQQLWRDALVAKGKFTWGLFYGGQQTAPGQNQTCGQCTCASYLRANCGAAAPTQNGTLFYGYSRVQHRVPFPLPSPDQDLAAFLLSRGPYAFFGYGWTGCIDSAHPFTRPPSLDVDYGTPTGFCSETATGSGVFTRNFTKVNVALDCNAWEATFTPASGQ